MDYTADYTTIVRMGETLKKMTLGAFNMPNLLCKIIGHKEKPVEEVAADVTVCPRCKEIQSAPTNENDPSPATAANSKGERELECPRCGFEDVSRSMFAGDSCPACNRGYLEESNTQETTLRKIYS